MDDRSTFSHQYESYDDDSGIEVPPSIGTDERRMHVRAYNFWVSLLDGQDFPSIEDLDPDHLHDFGPNSVLLDFTAGAENPIIAFLGDTLRTECDLADHIHSIAEVPPRTLLSRLTDHYLQIIANRAPVGFEAEFVNQRGMETMYRGILMPFSSDHDTIDFIYGVINWKEAADDEQIAGLHSEIDRVLAEAPIQIAPRISAWADGPNVEDSPTHPPETEAGQTLDPCDEPTEDLPAASLEDDAALADWLASARDAADVARTLANRGRGALYRAIGLAFDFALVAQARPDDFAELLADSGVVAHARAPMTPVAKLVFGIDFDKTRLTEVSTVLSYALAQDLPVGSLATHIEQFNGGLKGLLKAARATRRGATLSVPRTDSKWERARTLEPQAIFAVPGDDEFVVLIARRVDAEHVGVIGVAGYDASLIDRALQRLAG
jgi:hypothetical protein